LEEDDCPGFSKEEVNMPKMTDLVNVSRSLKNVNKENLTQ